MDLLSVYMFALEVSFPSARNKHNITSECNNNDVYAEAMVIGHHTPPKQLWLITVSNDYDMYINSIIRI